MNKLFRFSFMVVLVLGTFGVPNAALVVIDTNIVYDNTNDRYWVKDLTQFENKEYAEQISYVNSNINGNTAYVSVLHDYWHMASYDEMVTLWDNYSAQSILGVFTHTNDYTYYDINDNLVTVENVNGRYDYGFSNKHYAVGCSSTDETLPVQYAKGALNVNLVDDDRSSSYLGAWVTNATVPIPGAVWLLGSGLIGIVGIRRKFKK